MNVQRFSTAKFWLQHVVRFTLTLLIISLIFISTARSQTTNLFHFNEENLSHAGFQIFPAGGYNAGEIKTGTIPPDESGHNWSDGKGLHFLLHTGEGSLLFGPSINTGYVPCVIRVSVRVDDPGVSLFAGAFEANYNGSLGLNQLTNGDYLVNQYVRLRSIYRPQTGQLVPFIQAVHNGQTQNSINVYIDNLEIIPLTNEIIPPELSSLRGWLGLDEIFGPMIDPAVFTPTPNPIPTATPIPNNIPETITVQIPNLTTDAKPLEMQLVKAGSFLMGSPSDERGNGVYDGPEHPVEISRDFYMGKYEITQAQYLAVMGNNPSFFKTKINHPVETVSWELAASFCNALSRLEGKTPVYTERGTWNANMNANGYRLPTEAEWEYACRAGTETRFSHGNVLQCDDRDCSSCSAHDPYMWWCGNAGGQTQEAGMKLPNPWGFYDMHGNVLEWCQDGMQNYTADSVIDPFLLPIEQFLNYRVMRGGAWTKPAGILRSAYRDKAHPLYTDSQLGFRIVTTNVVAQPPATPTPTFTPIPTSTPISIPTSTPTSVTNTDPSSITVPLTYLVPGAKTLDMALIPAGSFMMGSPEIEGFEGYETPLHSVQISRDFYLGKYEITIGQYAAFLIATGKDSGVNWDSTSCPLARNGRAVSLRNNEFGQSWDKPMVEVTWLGAAMFCNYLSEIEGLQPVYTERGNWDANLNANGYRLPTEAEWEYACRAGTSTRYSHGDAFSCNDGTDGSNTFCEFHDRYMWYNGNYSLTPTNRVALKLPNPWGLYDMHGNVWEWCGDWFGYEYYSVSPSNDPAGPPTGDLKVLRGGSFEDRAFYCRSATRNSSTFDYYGAGYHFGFRIVKTQ